MRKWWGKKKTAPKVVYVNTQGNLNGEASAMTPEQKDNLEKNLKIFRGIIWDSIESLGIPYGPAMGTLKQVECELEVDYKEFYKHQSRK